MGPSSQGPVEPGKFPFHPKQAITMAPGPQSVAHPSWRHWSPTGVVPAGVAQAAKAQQQRQHWHHQPMQPLRPPQPIPMIQEPLLSQPGTVELPPGLGNLFAPVFDPFARVIEEPEHEQQQAPGVRSGPPMPVVEPCSPATHALDADDRNPIAPSDDKSPCAGT